MKKNHLLFLLGTLVLTGLSTTIAAQQFGFAADPGALNTLNEGGGGFNGQFALDRANGVAGGGGFGAQGQGFGGPAGDGGFGAQGGFGAPAGGAGFGGQAQGFGGQGFGAQGANSLNAGINATNDFFNFVSTYDAVYGKRIICPVTGQLLEDAREIEIDQREAGAYSDDGSTQFDVAANDTVYTSVEFVENQFMSPEAMLIKSKTLRNIFSLENYKPYEFANVIVASTDPLMDVPSVLGLEERRDKSLETWSEEFLENYRIDPGDATEDNSIFFQAYMPAPPLTPNVHIPSSFQPPRNYMNHFKELRERSQLLNESSANSGDFVDFSEFDDSFTFTENEGPTFYPPAATDTGLF